MKNNTTETNYSHNYVKADVHTISLSGQTTAYSAEPNVATIRFYSSSVDNFYHKKANTEKIASIDGSLGAIFGTLADGSQPRFNKTFYNALKMTGSIPENLFAGISCAPASSMFSHTFSGCSGLTSIPENLFGNISGTAQDYIFNHTFYNCTSLTGPSARINGQYLYEIWPDTTEARDMYYNESGLSDYSNIPSAWK